MLRQLFATETGIPAHALPAENSIWPKGGGFGASLIAADLAFNGTLVSEGNIHIDGFVKGDVRAVRLVVGSKGKIEGNVHARHVTVHGIVKGCIRAKHVVLTGTSRVEGEIHHEILAVETGCFVEGRCCRMERDNRAMPRDATLLAFVSAST